MYTYIYICICICTCIHIYVYTHIYLYTHVYVYVFHSTKTDMVYALSDELCISTMPNTRPERWRSTALRIGGHASESNVQSRDSALGVL